MVGVRRLGIADVWPVGAGFRPRENELIRYLKRKHSGLQEDCRVIPELDIYQWEPQALFEKYDEMSELPSDGSECFFFCVRKENNRMTRTGFWKETRQAKIVEGHDRKPIWSKRILVYHEGRQPKGRKTQYSMHEYYLSCPSKPKTRVQEMELLLCRVINRVGKIASPYSPSSEYVDPDPVTPGVSSAANQWDDAASQQVYEPSLVNMTDAAEETEEMMKYYDSLGDEQPQLLYPENDGSNADGCCCNSSSCNVVDLIGFDLDDIDFNLDGIFMSELLG